MGRAERKSKSKQIVIAVLVLLLLAPFAVGAANDLADRAVLQRTNRHIQVAGLALGQPPAATLEGFTERPGCFGCEDYISETDGVQIRFSGYPDVSNGFRLTEILLSKPRYSVYGLHVGDPIQSAVATLKQQGFREMGDSGERYVRFTRRRLRVILAGESGLITEIRIGLDSTNKQHIVF